MTKIAIVPENDADLYEYFTEVKCFECGGVEVDKTVGEASQPVEEGIRSATDTAVSTFSNNILLIKQVPKVVDAIMTSLSASRQSEIKAWEEEIVSCDHIRNLKQDAEKTVAAGKRRI